MLTLIKREIEDNYVFFLLALILSSVISILIGYDFYYSQKISVFTLTVSIWMSGLAGIFVFCAMGSSQMYNDRTKKISALLATLAVTRKKIFIARVLSGILAILVFALPAIGTITVGLGMIEPQMPFYKPGVFVLWIPVVLSCLAGYCLGLQTGWTLNKIIPSLGALSLISGLVGLVIIKGPSKDLYPILVLLIICSLLRAWRKYLTAAF
jgi:hypothetical protein